MLHAWIFLPLGWILYMEVPKGLIFLKFICQTLRFPNPEQKAYTYSKCYRKSFSHDPTYEEIRSWLEEQSRFLTHGHHFLFVDSDAQIVRRGYWDLEFCDFVAQCSLGGWINFGENVHVHNETLSGKCVPGCRFVFRLVSVSP